MTLLSMIAPSPDWMIAIDGIALLDDDGQWFEEIIIDVYPCDAGTNNGVDYTSTNSDTNPAQNITSLQDIFPFSLEKIRTLTITLDTILSSDNGSTKSKNHIYPNPTNGIITLTVPQSPSIAKVYNITGKLGHTRGPHENTTNGLK